MLLCLTFVVIEAVFFLCRALKIYPTISFMDFGILVEIFANLTVMYFFGLKLYLNQRKDQKQNKMQKIDSSTQKTDSMA